MRAIDPRVSFAELETWPEDGRRYELYDGEVVMVAMPLPRHQRVATNIGDVLKDYERARGGLVFANPIDIVLSEYDVVQPDVVFFREERRHLIDMMQVTRVPPDLAVEVLSRSTEARDRGRKMDLLARFRAPEYWIVDPVGNTLEVYTLAGAGYRLADVCSGDQHVQSPTLPGLSFAASRLFVE